MKEPEAHVSSPLQLLAETDPDFAESMWRFRHPEEGGTKLTYEAILVEVPKRWSVQVSSLDTLHRFYAWLRLRRDFRQKRDLMAQIKEELARDPDMSAEQVEEAGRLMFLTDSFAEKDAKIFATMVKLGQDKKALAQRDETIRQKDEQIEQLERKLEHALKGKLEAGLDALFEEIKGNKEAEAAFVKLRAALPKR